jgi:hypothetical protein
MGPLRSWYGSYPLKRDILARIDHDLELPSLRPLEYKGREVNLYGWPNPPDLDGLRALLGVPVSLLAIGLELFDSFPETEEGIRQVIAARRQFLAAVPVGVELSWVASEFAARRLLDDRVGVVNLSDDPLLRRLLERIATGLRQGVIEPADEAAVRAELEEWRAEIPRQWQAQRRVEPEVYAAVRLLETALAACEVPRDPRAVVQLAYGPTQGVALDRSIGGGDEVGAMLLELLGSPT